MDTNFLKTLLILPFLLFLCSTDFRSQCKSHIYLVLGQVCLFGYTYLVSGIFFHDLSYLILFFYSPHLGLLIFNNLSRKNLLITLYISIFFLAIYCSLAILSFVLSDVNFTWDHLRVFSFESFLRLDNSYRNNLLDAFNIGKNIFGVDTGSLRAMDLTIYPITILAFLASIRVGINWLSASCFVLSIIPILIKNSRGEILFICLLGFVLVFKSLLSKRISYFITLGMIPFFSLQLFLSGKSLNGRILLNEAFLKNVSFLGSGLGFSKILALEVTNGSYGSFHNIHLEAILNFGIFIYGFSLFAFLFVLYKVRNGDILFMVSGFVFILLSTNYQLIDPYLWVTLALLFASERIRNEYV